MLRRPRPYQASLFHGSGRAAQIRASGEIQLGPGNTIFATSFENEARGYAGTSGEVFQVDVNLASAFVVEEGESLGQVLRDLGVQPVPSYEGERAIAKRMQELGYDGLVQQLAEDLRDPSDPYPARAIVRIFDPAAISLR